MMMMTLMLIMMTFRWISIIPLLQIYLFRLRPLLSPSSQYRHMAKTLQTSFGGGERERRREKREAKGGRERERTERERRRERLLSAERSLPVRCLISFKPLNDFGFQGQSPEEAFLSCETFFREKLQEKKKKRKRREIWRKRERELVRRHSGHRRLLVTCCVAFAGSKSSRTLQTRA